MEYSLISAVSNVSLDGSCLNPYSNGTLSDLPWGVAISDFSSLNPYSNGTLSDFKGIVLGLIVVVLILILMEHSLISPCRLNCS